MPTDLSKIRNIVVVMAENRSFDHMLGYLSLPPSNRNDVDGLRDAPDWVAHFTNYDQGEAYAPFLGENPYTMPNKFDPPHERPDVAGNLGPLQNNTYPMNGFVSSIPASVSDDPVLRRLVMSYFSLAHAPMNEFFAQNYAICDRWFSSLPAGTQPNRLMSMSGYSLIDVNHDILPEHHLVYDWLSEHDVSWRVYHQGVPFFIMMPKWLPEILRNDRFRSLSNLEGDLISTPPDKFPQVIFVEPTYQDAPHLGWSTDAHAPSGISNGQEFLMVVYNAVSNSRAFWRGALMIVDYDEHGGFFDHVSPPMIPTAVPACASYNTLFASLGVRIPNYVISPFVQAGSVHHTLLDHTSVLKLIGEKFGTNGSYSTLVDARPVESLSSVLNFDVPMADPPSPPALNDYLAKRGPAPVGATVPTQNTKLQIGFQKAVSNLKQQGADASHPKFGKLLAAMGDVAV